MKSLQALSARWPEISALLDQALALPAADRAAWLAALPADQAPLTDTLRALLARQASVEADDFMGHLPSLATQADTVGDEAAAGDTVGPYRLLSALGRGGMGAVWLAERSDGQLKRQVALKLPRLAWGGALAERLARERDILATLAHPHIARLYDAGVDQHGRPYLALEYVQGQPIDEYCRQRAVPLPGVLALLLQVAAAVAHAHARLVVHRDLKPANILVDAEGQVRLLDFGIAKLMDEGRTQETALTRVGGHALTLDYASPEQIRGEPLGTASDVYSLAVVAFLLLTGSKPYALKRGSAAELEEAIASADPPLASRVAGTPALRKALRGDLDAILNRALKKAAADRYPSVDALAQDIERHLNGQPVLARPDGKRYRAWKFVRRHWVGVATASTVVLSIAVGGGVAVWQALTARDQAQRAAAEVGRQAGVLDLYLRTMARLSVLGAQDPAALTQPRAVTRVLLDTLRELGPAFEKQPSERQGQLAAVMVQLNLGNEFEASLAVGQEYLAHMKKHGASADMVIRAYTSMGRNLFQLGRFEESAATRRAGVAWAPDVNDVRTEHNRLILAGDLGNSLTTLGQRTEALAVLQRSDAVAARVVPQSHERFLNMHRLGLFYLVFDDARALQYARQAHAGVLTSGTALPIDHAYDRRTLATALLANGQAAQAEAALRESLTLTEAEFGRHSRNGVRAIGSLAGAMASQGKHAPTRELLNGALAALPVTPQGPPLLAGLLRARQLDNEWLFGDFQAAQAWVAADPAPWLAPAAVREYEGLLLAEARVLAGAGRGRDALARVQALRRSWPDPDRATAAWVRITDAWAAAQLAAGDAPAARQTAQGLMALLDAQQARASWAYRSAAETAALAAARSGDLPAAERTLAVAQGGPADLPVPSGVDRAESLLRQAEVLSAIGRAAEARAAGEAALAALQGQHPSSPRLVLARHWAAAPSAKP